MSPKTPNREDSRRVDTYFASLAEQAADASDFEQIDKVAAACDFDPTDAAADRADRFDAVFTRRKGINPHWPKCR